MSKMIRKQHNTRNLNVITICSPYLYYDHYNAVCIVCSNDY